jgi:hypothetical protein
MVSPRKDHAPVPFRLAIRIPRPIDIIVVPTGNQRIHFALGRDILK